MQARKRIRQAEGDNGEAVFDHQLTPDDKNPLLNSVVLERFFEMCHSSDLPQFRLVSKLWFSISLTRFRSEMLIEIGRPVPLGAMKDNLRVLRWTSLGQELDAVAEKPFRKFRLHNVLLFCPQHQHAYPSHSTQIRTMNQFWVKYGTWIRTLDLQFPQVFCVKAFKKAIFEDTPNLEELVIYGLMCKFRGAPDVGEWNGQDISEQKNLRRLVVESTQTLPVSWRLMFIHFPKIQELEMRGLRRSFGTSDNLTEFAETCEELRKYGCIPPKITVTDCSFDISSGLQGTDDLKKLLLLPGISFTRLGLCLVDYGNEEMDLISTALLHHWQKLTEIYVNAYEISEQIEHFPFETELSFQAVTWLDLEGYLCRNLHFLEQFPNLDRLRLGQSEEDRLLQGTDLLRMERVRLTHLTNFEFMVNGDGEGERFDIPDETMEMFVKMMPNLKEFYGQLTNSALRIICRRWKQLTGLTIDAYEMKDEVITGIIEGCEERLPNLTDLRDLEDLEFSNEGDGEWKITDISVWNGFMKLPRLNRLMVELDPWTSDEAFRALKEKLSKGEYTSVITRLPNFKLVE